MKKIFVFLLTLVIMFVFTGTIMVNAIAESYHTRDNEETVNEFNLSNDILKKVKKNSVYHNDSFSTTGKISMPYNINIFQFETKEAGYYAFYTTGNTDTIIKIYHVKERFLRSDEYIDLGSNDDGCLASNRCNACMIIKCDINEKLYICVRAFNKKTGSFTLFAEPNEDKSDITMTSKHYWNLSDPGQDHARIQEYGCPLTTYSYLTKEETLLLYIALSLEVPFIELNGKNYYIWDLCNLYKKDMEKFNAVIGSGAALLSCLPSLSTTAMGLIVTVVNIITTEILNTSYDSDELADLIRVDCKIQVLELTPNGSYGYSMKFDIKYGLCIMTFDTRAKNSTKKVYASLSNIMVGKKYDKGIWY